MNISVTVRAIFSNSDRAAVVPSSTVMPWLRQVLGNDRTGNRTGLRRKSVLPLRMGTEPSNHIENTKHLVHENNFVCRFMRCLTPRG